MAIHSLKQTAFRLCLILLNSIIFPRLQGYSYDFEDHLLESPRWYHYCTTYLTAPLLDFRLVMYNHYPYDKQTIVSNPINKQEKTHYLTTVTTSMVTFSNLSCQQTIAIVQRCTTGTTLGKVLVSS